MTAGLNDLRWARLLGLLAGAGLLAIALLGLLDRGGGPLSGSAGAGAPAAKSGAGLVDAYGKLPLRFEPNRGQSDPRVRFLSRGAGYSLFLTQGEAVLSLSKARPVRPGAKAPHGAAGGAAATLRLRPLGADPTAWVGGEQRLAGHSNYLSGDDPRRWRTGVPGYGRVVYRGVYPGVDLVYHGRQGALEYDFVVAPGRDPGRIVMGLSGHRALWLDARGDVVVHTAAGDVRQRRPVAYQQWGNTKRPVAARYVVQDKGRIGFALGAYDRSRPLVIDPVLSYSTYLGGNSSDFGNGVAVDGSGSAYVAGHTASPNFPSKGAAQPASGGGNDAFVTKLTPDGSGFAYSTYLGGSGPDFATSVAVDSSGSAYVTGYTSSTAGFPIKNAVQGASGGGYDAWVTKLTPDGSGFAYSTYLGGNGSDWGYDIAVDASGSAHISGSTDSTNMPLKDALQPTRHGGSDAFVTKLTPQGSSLSYSTYLGGEGLDGAGGITVDASGNAYVTGQTYVTGAAGTPNSFPTTTGAFQTEAPGGGDAFVAKLNQAGSSLLYSTYLGGTGQTGFVGDEGAEIAVDASGSAYVTGNTRSTDFPTQAPVQSTSGGGQDAFVTKLKPDGSGLEYSSYLGGASNDFAAGIAVDSSSNAHVTGLTQSEDFPTKDAVQARKEAYGEAFVTRLNTAAAGQDSLIYSTYLGGGGDDRGNDIALDASGDAYLAGTTSGDDFPTRGVQPEYGGNYDGFAAKIVAATPAEPAVTGMSPRGGSTGGGTVVEISGRGFTGATAVRFGNARAESFTVESDSKLTAVSPPNRAGSVYVTVANQGGSSRETGIGRFTYFEGHWAKTGPLPAGATLGDRAVQLANRKVLVVGRSSAYLYDPATDSWSQTGNLTTERGGTSFPPQGGHSVTALPDGRAVVAGGADARGQPIAAVDVFDPNANGGTGAFTASPVPMEHPRSGHTATLIAGPVTVCGASCGKVLVAGGWDPTLRAGVRLPSRTAELYDPVTGTWRVTGSMRSGYVNHRAVQLATDPLGSARCGSNCGKVLAYGGPKFLGEGNYDPEIWDPLTGAWTETLGSALLSPRFQSMTLLADGKVLSAGGQPGSDLNPPTQEAEVYKPASLNTTDDPAWRPTAGMRMSRTHHAAALLPSGKVLMAGGNLSPELYEPGAEKWLQIAPVGETHGGSTATLLSSTAPAAPAGFEADPAACGQWCGKVLVAGWAQGPEIYTPAPTLTAISRDTGPAEGGTTVTLTGTGFTNGTRAVRFGDVAVACPSQHCKIDSYHKLTVTSPAHAPGPVEVTVVNIGGLSEGPTVRFTYTGAASGGGPPSAPSSPSSSTTPGSGGPQRGGGGSTDPVPASEARRASDLRSCLAKAAAAAKPRGKGRLNARARRRAAAVQRAARRRCLKLYARTPGRVTRLQARALSSTKIALSFHAPGTDGSRPPAARSYVVKQALRSISGAHGFARARTLCGRVCRFSVTQVGTEITLTITGLRPRTTYYYAVAARDNVSGRSGPRSQTVKARTH